MNSSRAVSIAFSKSKVDQVHNQRIFFPPNAEILRLDVSMDIILIMKVF